MSVLSECMPVLFLTSGVQNVEQTCLAIDDHLFAIRVFNSRIVFVNET